MRGAKRSTKRNEHRQDYAQPFFWRKWFQISHPVNEHKKERGAVRSRLVALGRGCDGFVRVDCGPRSVSSVLCDGVECFVCV